MKALFRIGAFGTTGYLVAPMALSNTELHYQPTNQNEEILEQCQGQLRRYMPSLHLSSGVFQALWQVFAAKDKKLPITYERDILRMSDGGSISIDWVYPPEDLVSNELTKVCFIFPGLSGGSDRGYVKSLVKHMQLDKGYIVGVFHNRGVGYTEYTSAEFADLSRSEEVEAAFNHMQEKFKHMPNVYYTGVGMSMGANVMMKAAGEMGSDFPLKGIVAFNNPFDIWLAINLMRGTPYEKHLARELRKNLVIRENQTEQEKEIYQQMIEKFKIDLDSLKKVQTWKDFDELFTLKIHPQYTTAAEYYYASSCLTKVKNIQVPTLVIHSKDDPIIPIDCLPLDECLANEHIIVGIVRKGGHVCYFQGMNGQTRWYPLVSGEYLDAVINIKERHKRAKQIMLNLDNSI